MSDREDYEATREAASAILVSAVENPGMPVEVFTKEAEALRNWVEDDKGKFEQVDFDLNIFNLLEVQIGALRYAEAVWNNRRLVKNDVSKLLASVTKEAEELLDEVGDAMNYAYFGNDDLLKVVQNACATTSSAELPLNLAALEDLGRRNSAPLEKIKFKMEKLDACSALANKLGELQGAMSSEQLKNSVEKENRDRAYTLCKQTVDLIRRCGKYVTRDNPARAKGYTSRYHLRFRNKKKEPVPEVQAGTPISE